MKCYRETDHTLRLVSGLSVIAFPSEIEPLVIESWSDPVSKEENYWRSWLVKYNGEYTIVTEVVKGKERSVEIRFEIKATNAIIVL